MLRNRLRWCFEIVVLTTPLTGISTAPVEFRCAATRDRSYGSGRNATTFVEGAELGKLHFQKKSSWIVMPLSRRRLQELPGDPVALLAEMQPRFTEPCRIFPCVTPQPVCLLHSPLRVAYVAHPER